MMRVTVLHHIPTLNFLGLPVQKTWLIFGYGVKRPDDLDL